MIKFTIRTREIKGKRVVVKPCPFVEKETRQRPEPLAYTVQLDFRVSKLDPKELMNVLVETLK